MYVGDQKFTWLICIKTGKFSNGQVFELMNDRRRKEVKAIQVAIQLPISLAPGSP